MGVIRIVRLSRLGGVLIRRVSICWKVWFWMSLNNAITPIALIYYGSGPGLRGPGAPDPSCVGIKKEIPHLAPKQQIPIKDSAGGLRCVLVLFVAVFGYSSINYASLV